MDKTAWEASLSILSTTEKAIQINGVQVTIPKKLEQLTIKNSLINLEKQVSHINLLL